MPVAALSPDWRRRVLADECEQLVKYRCNDTETFEFTLRKTIYDVYALESYKAFERRNFRTFQHEYKIIICVVFHSMNPNVFVILYQAWLILYIVRRHVRSDVSEGNTLESGRVCALVTLDSSRGSHGGLALRAPPRPGGSWHVHVCTKCAVTRRGLRAPPLAGRERDAEASRRPPRRPHWFAQVFSGVMVMFCSGR